MIKFGDQLIPKDVFVMMALDFNLQDILNLCRSSKKFNDLLCNNDKFWMKKLERDYGRFGHDPSVMRDKKGDMTWKQYYKTLKEVLREHKNNPSAENNYPIRLASEIGNINDVRVLLNDNRVDPTAIDNYAIGVASKNGNTEVVRLLLTDDRVDPSADNNYAIDIASTNGNTEVVRLLLTDDRVDPSSNNNYAIRIASLKGHTDVVRLLLDDERTDPYEAYKVAYANELFEAMDIIKKHPRYIPGDNKYWWWT